MKTINSDIKNNKFKNIYLLCGEEAYLKKQYRDKLKNALIDADDNMNYSYYEGNKINSVELLDTGETLPFFAERRVVIIENSGYFKSAPDNFLERLIGFPDSTYIIFVETEVDKRSKLYKKIKEIGYVADFSTPDANMLSTWIGGLCKSENKKISQATVNYMLEVIGMDMTTIKFELEKLFSYAYDKDVITIEDVN